MKLENYIARRYLFSRRKINFITIITFISVIGVTIGVAAMIIVLSVFNGFSKKVTDILVGFDPHIRIESSQSGATFEYDKLLEKIEQAGISNAAEFTLNKGMLANKFKNRVLFIKGVDQDKIGKVSGLKEVTELGDLSLQDEGDFGGIVIGLSLADQLKTDIGDTLTLMSPVGLESALTQFVEPLTKQFIIRGIYDSENKDYDSKYAYVSLQNAQGLFKLGNKVNGIEIRLKNINDSEDIKNKLQNEVGSEYSVMSWYDLHKDFYSLLKIERWVAFIILSLIILVATFNILASLTMTVIEKKRDIGILKAMGATDNTITKIFLAEGILVGLVGMFAGSFLGLGVTLCQKYFAFYKLDSVVYRVSALPVDLRWADFVFVPLAALVLCVLASIYPARKAAKLNPVESIRWE